MTENVPPPENDETHGMQGVASVARRGANASPSPEMSRFVPASRKNVPTVVPPQTRVEAIGFGGYYCAVFRRDGAADQLLDDADGRPQRFPSAYAAIRAGKASLVPEATSLATAAKTLRADRNKDIDEERRRVFANFDKKGV